MLCRSRTHSHAELLGDDKQVGALGTRPAWRAQSSSSGACPAQGGPAAAPEAGCRQGGGLEWDAGCPRSSRVLTSRPRPPPSSNQGLTLPQGALDHSPAPPVARPPAAVWASCCRPPQPHVPWSRLSAEPAFACLLACPLNCPQSPLLSRYRPLCQPAGQSCAGPPPCGTWHGRQGGGAGGAGRPGPPHRVSKPTPHQHNSAQPGRHRWQPPQPRDRHACCGQQAGAPAGRGGGRGPGQPATAAA